jgi:hypothetical protein
LLTSADDVVNYRFHNGDVDASGRSMVQATATLQNKAVRRQARCESIFFIVHEPALQCTSRSGHSLAGALNLFFPALRCALRFSIAAFWTFST